MSSNADLPESTQDLLDATYLVPVEYPDTRAGCKALKAISRLKVCDAMQLSGVVIAELVNSQDLDREMIIVELPNGYYRIDVRKIRDDEVESSLKEGLELRRRGV